ncbi:energy-coupling factor transporter transmembrane component T family protein [Sporosarcina trichiuri]|uniref:energy-coupling factor transporter transmembrane component T family protein n=1 Tax=Sporosarcina trichiuri TaxID=3056445 RepID=UPI0025B415D2|nr:energy-coupling factor transporter transmembrane component T [Sporosarcina sp. 0.2-SM1T-5]WJY27262.1 energy-coupling factor transporter transmembrane component T [Sporosarcina sp. 0.2-SM1T-5]
MPAWFTPERTTWLHRVNPALKFAVFVLLLLVMLFNRNLPLAGWLAVLFAVLLYGFSGYSLKKLALLSIPIALSFASSAVTMALFGKGDTVLWQWGIFKISEESIRHGLLLGTKSLSFGFAGFAFLLTVEPVLFFYAMMQQFRLSSKYAYSFIASIRLLPVIVEEIQVRNNALKVRGITFSPGLKGVGERIQSYTVPLFAQSIRRAQRIAIAMEAKQYQMGAARTYFYPTSYSRMDAVFLVLMAGSVAAAGWLAYGISY